jgi:photosystem II stability/assembly factor-like uncharacterized protein
MMRVSGWAAMAVICGLGIASSSSGQDRDAATSLTLFAGTTEGPFRSLNWGGSWEPITNHLVGDDPAQVGATFAIHPIGPWVLLGGEGGLFLSIDFGDSWEKLGLEGSALSLVPSRYPQADPTLFAGTANGLLKSEDLGQSFARTPLQGTSVRQVLWPGPALVVGTDAGVEVSPDGGRSFSGSGVGLPAGRVEAIALSSFFSIDPVMFAAVGAEGVFRSSDGASTWSPAGLAGHRVRDLYWLGPFLYAVDAAGVFRSEDLGEQWERIDEGLEGAQPIKVLFPLAPASGAVVFLATSQGFFLSNDGGMHWGRVGAPNGEPLCLATFPPPEPSAGRDR